MAKREVTKPKQFVSYLLALNIGLGILAALVNAAIIMILLGLGLGKTAVTVVTFIFIIPMIFVVVNFSVKLALRKYILLEEQVNRVLLIYGLLYLLLFGFNVAVKAMDYLSLVFNFVTFTATFIYIIKLLKNGAEDQTINL